MRYQLPTASTRNHSRCTSLGPRDTFYQHAMRFLLAVALPEVSAGQHGPSLDNLIIRDDTGSSARLDTTQDGSFLVTEIGPRALWAKLNRSTLMARLPAASPRALRP